MHACKLIHVARNAGFLVAEDSTHKICPADRSGSRRTMDLAVMYEASPIESERLNLCKAAHARTDQHGADCPRATLQRDVSDRADAALSANVGTDSPQALHPSLSGRITQEISVRRTIHTNRART